MYFYQFCEKMVGGGGNPMHIVPIFLLNEKGINNGLKKSFQSIYLQLLNILDV